MKVKFLLAVFVMALLSLKLKASTSSPTTAVKSFAAPTITSFSPASGPAGTVVTVTGTGLLGATSFTIGGAQALKISNTSTTLVLMVMPNSFSGAITVSTPGGSVASSSQFTLQQSTIAAYPVGPAFGITDSRTLSSISGLSLSGDGNTLAVQGSFTNGSSDVFIFSRSGNTWIQDIALPRPANNLPYDNIILNADGTTFAGNTGQSAWVIAKQNGVWSIQQNLSELADKTPDYSGRVGFGSSIAMTPDGNTVVVGGLYDNVVGSAWVFGRIGSFWARKAKITLPSNTASANGGAAVAISANAQVIWVNYAGRIGGENEDGTTGRTGEVISFTYNGTKWVQASYVDTRREYSDGPLELNAYGTIGFVSTSGASVVKTSYTKYLITGATNPKSNIAGDRMLGKTKDGLVPYIINTDNFAAGAVIPGSTLFFDVSSNGKIGVKTTSATQMRIMTDVPPVSAPLMTVSDINGQINACLGSYATAPNISQFTINGNNLTNNVDLVAPANFEISINATTGYAANLSISPSSGKLNQIIYVRSKPRLSPENITGQVSISSSGARALTVSVTAKMVDLPYIYSRGRVTVDDKGTVGNLTFGTNDPVTWTNSRPEIGLPKSGTGDIKSFVARNTTSEIITATIRATVTSPFGCTSQTTFTIRVNPLRRILSVTAATGNISACANEYSSPANSRVLSFKGEDLKDNVIVTPTSAFEVAEDIAGPYKSSIILTKADAESGKNIFIRNKPSATAGTINGAVVFTSADAPDLSYSLTAKLFPVPKLNTITNKQFTAGSLTTPISFQSNNEAEFVWTNDNPAIGLPASGNGTIPAFMATSAGSTANINVLPTTPAYSYFVNKQSSTISRVNLTTNTVKDQIPASGITSLWLSPDRARYYYVTISTITAYDEKSGNFLSDVPFGLLARPEFIVETKNRNKIFVAGLRGGLSVVDGNNYKLIKVISSTQDGSENHPIALTDDDSKLVIANGATSTLSFIDVASNTITNSISIPEDPRDIATGKNGIVYVSHYKSRKVTVINTATNTIIKSITLPYPSKMAISLDKKYLFVSTPSDITVIDATTNTIKTSIPLYSDRLGISVGLNPKLVYVASITNQIFTIDIDQGKVIATTAVASPSSFGNSVLGSPGCSGDPTSFSINITQPSQSLQLSALSVNSGTLTPTFSGSNFNYSDTVSLGTTSLKITPTATSSSSIIKVNGVVVTSGQQSHALSLKPGNNLIRTVVYSGTADSLTYSVNVYRPLTTDIKSIATTPSSVVTMTGPMEYTTTVPYTVSSLAVNVIAQSNQSNLSINNKPIGQGVNSQPITLNEYETRVPISIYDAADIAQKNYTLIIRRQGSTNNSLASIKLSPGSTPVLTTGPANRNYLVSVPMGTNSVTVTPTAENPLAQILVNNVAVASGSTTNPITLTGDTTRVAMTVTAANGIKKATYSIAIVKSGSSNTSLVSIDLKPVSKLTASNGLANRNYTMSVAAGTNSVDITVVGEQLGQVIKINGMVASSGEAFGPIALTGTSTLINMTVTAPNGVTTSTYGITVTKSGSTNTNLAILNTNPGNISPSFLPNILDYTITVPNSRSTIAVTAVHADTAATVRINGIPTSKTNFFVPGIALKVGSNMIYTVVTSANGTVKTYTINVIRQGPTTFAFASKQKSMLTQEGTENGAPTVNELIVRQAVSPNGDGVNDQLIIDGLQKFPENSLQIMNSTGALVFEAKGYGTSSKLFDGHASNGKLQPAGTYFYVLEFVDGKKTQRKTGYLVLKY